MGPHGIFHAPFDWVHHRLLGTFEHPVRQHKPRCMGARAPIIILSTPCLGAWAPSDPQRTLCNGCLSAHSATRAGLSSGHRQYSLFHTHSTVPKNVFTEYPITVPYVGNLNRLLTSKQRMHINVVLKPFEEDYSTAWWKLQIAYFQISDYFKPPSKRQMANGKCKERTTEHKSAFRFSLFAFLRRRRWTLQHWKSYLVTVHNI